ncbi:MAG: AraC family transcriptional regulator ligand-binding domain-containing protein [Planctomycetota bacterium]|nr:AraC family transcriptional regulator ligand-binding domain-containing protein [Planctomycetota bacterium]
MGWIPVLFARKALDLAGTDVARPFRHLLARPGSEPMMRDADFFDLLEHLRREAPDGRSIPVRVGASMRCNDYGAFGLAFKSAIDLGSSYRRVERYGRVVTTTSNFRLLPGDDTSLFEVIPGSPDRTGLRLTNELALAAAVSISREVYERPFTPVAVHLSQDAPDDSTAFDTHFGCPMHYNADRDALEVSAVQLEQPNRLGDDSISRFFDTHLDGALAELPSVGGLIQRVKSEISNALSEGTPTLSEIATRLAMSRRTLQRRLAEEDVNFQDVITEVQHTLAKQLLRASDCELVEIAFLTGFSDQSSFGRAFKRWTGETPRSYRLGASG